MLNLGFLQESQPPGCARGSRLLFEQKNFVIERKSRILQVLHVKDSSDLGQESYTCYNKLIQHIPECATEKLDARIHGVKASLLLQAFVVSTLGSLLHWTFDGGRSTIFLVALG